MPSSQGQNHHGQRWACGTQLALIWILTSATKYKYCGTLTTVHVPLPASAANSTTWEGFSKSHCFQCPQSQVKGQTVARGWKLEKAAYYLSFTSFLVSSPFLNFRAPQCSRTTLQRLQQNYFAHDVSEWQLTAAVILSDPCNTSLLPALHESQRKLCLCTRCKHDCTTRHHKGPTRCVDTRVRDCLGETAVSNGGNRQISATASLDTPKLCK